MNSQKRIDSFFKKSDSDTPKKKQCQEKDVNSGLFRLASVEFSKCAARAKVQASNLATSGCLLASKFQALLAQGLVSLKVKVEHCLSLSLAGQSKLYM